MRQGEVQQNGTQLSVWLCMKIWIMFYSGRDGNKGGLDAGAALQWRIQNVFLSDILKQMLE